MSHYQTQVMRLFCVCVGVRACVSAWVCVRVWVRACVFVCVCAHVGVFVTLRKLQMWFQVWALQTVYRRSSPEQISILSETCVCVCLRSVLTDGLSWRMTLLFGLILAVSVLVLAAGHSVESGCLDFDFDLKDSNNKCCKKCKPGEWWKKGNKKINTLYHDILREYNWVF